MSKLRFWKQKLSAKRKHIFPSVVNMTAVNISAQSVRYGIRYVRRHWLQRIPYQSKQYLAESGLFDAEWYYKKYPDVHAAGIDALEHFLHDGWREGRNPSALFHTDWYLEKYRDVKITQINPLIHYMQYGVKDDRRPNPLFFTRWYADRYAAEIYSSQLHPLAHYEQFNLVGKFDPNPFFNTAYVSTQNEFLKSEHLSGLAAYFSGSLEDTEFGPDIDTAWYNRHVPGSTRYSSHVVEDIEKRPYWEHAEANADEHKTSTIIRRKNLGTDIELGTVRLVIGIVGYNTEISDLVKCIAGCLKSQQLLSSTCITKMMFIDNGKEFAKRSLGPAIEVFESVGNIGFGAAHNILMSAAFEREEASHYVALNPDAVMSPETLLGLLSMSRATRDAALIEATQFPDEHPKEFDFHSFETPWVSGACLLVPKNIYDKVGGFDENFFLYCEDVDLSWRARAAGYTTKICPAALVYHPTGHRKFDALEHQRFLESGLLLGEKWGNRLFASSIYAELKKLYPESDKLRTK